MPTKKPLVNIVVESLLYAVMNDLASREGVSMSTLARDLIREALELREDVALAVWASEREETFSRDTALSHEKLWK